MTQICHHDSCIGQFRRAIEDPEAGARPGGWRLIGRITRIPAKPHPDRVISARAARQHGVVERGQLLADGLTADQVAGRLRRGALQGVYRGVYAVGQPRVSALASYMASVLACGPGAALSHRSAGAVWEIRPSGRERVEVSVPPGRHPARDGVEVHRTALEAHDTTSLQGIPVTTPARTLIDLADVLTHRALERALDEAEYLRLDCTGLRPHPGRRGAGRLALVLGHHDPGATRTRSPLEGQFLEPCRDHAVPRPAVNVLLHGHTELGYDVIRFTWRQLTQDPAGTALRLLRLLRRAPIDSPA